jgi:hypothetical protein
MGGTDGTDVYQSAPHDDSGSYDSGDSKVKMIRLVTGALHGNQTRSGTSSKGAALRLATARQPLVGSGLEPARLETAGGVPRDLASKLATSRPDKESWDFDRNKQDSGEEKNLSKPHANP